jgi:hypothetical protein
MEFFEALGNAWATESPTIMLVVLFIGFGAYLLNFIRPVTRQVVDLGDKFIDDVAKPMIPLAVQAVGALDTHGKALEAQTKSNQQLVDALMNRNRDIRELFEIRIKQVVTRVGELEEGMQKLTEENLNLRAENQQLKAENKQLKAELERVKQEGKRLKEELAKVKKEISRDVKKA